MRVAFDARTLGGAASGIGTYSANLLRELLRADEDLELLLVVRRLGVAAELGLERTEEIRFDAPPRSLRTLYLLRPWLSRARFDLFHCPFNILPSGFRRPTVVTVHDLMQLQNPANIATSRFVQATAGRFWRVRTAHAIRNGHAVLAVSQATKDAISERFPEVPEARVSISSNGTDRYFDEEASAEDRAEARALVGVGPKVPMILIVGNESPHKNHLRAVQAFLAAFSADDPTRLVIVRRSVRHDPRMKELLARPEVCARTIVLPHVDRHILRALYTEARIFFFPSWVEGFGLPILEAFACGCPVLTSDRSAPAEVADDAALTASPFSVDQMADALRRLTTDEELRADLVTRGRARVEHYTWRRTAEATLQAYARVLAAPDHRKAR